LTFEVVAVSTETLGLRTLTVSVITADSWGPYRALTETALRGAAVTGTEMGENSRVMLISLNGSTEAASGVITGRPHPVG
jgi:hypothetical protein